MSTPVALPEFQVREGFLYIARVGTAAGDVLGQVASVRMQSNSPTRKIPRLGDTNKFTSYSPVEHNANIELYAEGDPIGLAKILNGDQKPPTGGWDGTELLYLNPANAAYTLYVDQYETNTGGTTPPDLLEGTWELAGFKPASLQTQMQADSVVTITIAGECNSVIYKPQAGIGA